MPEITNKELKAIAVLYERTETYNDEGPEGEGWDSDTLAGARWVVQQLLKRFALPETDEE